MRPVRILTAGAVLTMAAVACGAGGGTRADQGTVRTCFNTIGVKEPDALELGSVQGWINVAVQADKESKDAGVRAASKALAVALNPGVQADGFDQAERDRYIAAVKQMLKACKDAKAFEGDPRK